jgi:hypothetical protein
VTEIKLGQMYASLCNSAQKTSGAIGDKTEQMDDRVTEIELVQKEVSHTEDTGGGATGDRRNRWITELGMRQMYASPWNSPQRTSVAIGDRRNRWITGLRMRQMYALRRH